MTRFGIAARAPADGREGSDASWEASIERVTGEKVTNTSHVVRQGFGRTIGRGAADPEYGLIPTSERGAPFPTHSVRPTPDDD